MNNLDKGSKHSIELLKFALLKKTDDQGAYFIGEEGDEKALHDKLCLLHSNEKWIVLYTERGQVFDRSVHESLDYAIKDFYGRLVRNPSPWDYREEWEKETGKEF